MKKAIQIPEVNTFYRAGLVLLIIKVLCSVSAVYPTNDLVDTLLSVLGAAFLGISILRKRHPEKIWNLFAVIGLLSVITTIKMRNVNLLLIIITCFAVCGEEPEDTISFLFSYEVILVLLQVVIAFVAAGLFGASIMTKVSGEWKVNFGFSHPNVFSIILINLAVMYGWLNDKIIRGKRLITIILIVGGTYLFTGSRTALLAIVIYAVLLLVYKDSFRKYKSLEYAAKWSVPVFSIIIYILSRLYPGHNPVIVLLDKLLSGRVRLIGYAIEKAGLTWLGQSMKGIPAKWDDVWKIGVFVFDSVYVYFFVTLGIVWLIILGVIFYKLAQKGDTRINIAIVMWALYGITEMHCLNPYMFMTLILVSVLYKDKAGSENMCLGYEWFQQKIKVILEKVKYEA